MKLQLHKLTLRNFKGIRELTLEAPGGNDLYVYGANRAGKTTIADAVSWLLFDKDSAGRAKFEKKTLTESGEPLHNLEHEVEATFLADAGTITLRRVYAETYTKKRGSLTAEFTGHTTTYYVNDVPVTMGQYQTKVEEMAIAEDRFRLLTNPTAFVSLHWEKQRKLLVEICGGVSDADIIAENPDLSELPTILGGKSCDDFKAIVMGQRKKINDEIETIPGKISILSESLPDLKVTNTTRIIANLTKLRNDLEAKSAELAAIKSGGGSSAINTEIAGIDGQIQELRNSLSAKNNAALQGKRDELSELKDRLAEWRRGLSSAEYRLIAVQDQQRVVSDEIDGLRADYKTIKAAAFTGTYCPTCNQVLPADQLEQARANFNQEKAARLEKNISQGSANKARLEEIGAEIERLTVEIATARQAIADNEKEVADLEAAIKSFTDSAPKVEDLQEYEDLAKQRADLVAKVAEIQSGNMATITVMEQEKGAIQAKIEKQEGFIAAIEQSQNLQDQIAKLKDREKQLAGEYAVLEKHLFLIEEFIRAKVSALETKINEKFNLVTWKLFSEQVNGGVTETCEAMVGGVPYSNVNGAGKVQAGLDIISTLSGYYGCHPMVFIDNRESVTEIPEMRAQIISLIVSPADATLRVETEPTKKAA